MQKNNILLGKEAREKLVQGVELMYQCVCTTLSPRGRNVAIARQWGAPIVMHDGVTVARDVTSDDKFIKMGIDLIREAAQKTVDEVGDGTTTSTLLAYHLVKNGMKLIEDGKNPMELRKELQEALEVLLAELPKYSRPVSGVEDLKKVATVSSSDEVIGSLVAEAINKIGDDGQITAEESQSTETYLEYTEGMTFDSGMADPRFMTNPNRIEAVVKDAIVAVIDRKVTTNPEIVPLLTAMIKVSKNIVIFGDLGGDALGTVLVNKMKGNFSALVVPIPSYGDQRQGYLDDIATATGAIVLSKELGLEEAEFNSSFSEDWLGSAKRIVSSKKNTIIVGGGGDQEDIDEQVARLKTLKSNPETNKYERENYEERLAKLTTGVAIIKVGGKTEIDTRERVERVKDSIGATQAAKVNGIVAGSGTAFLQIREALYSDNMTDGARLLFDILAEHIEKVLINSGVDNRIEIVDKIVSNLDKNYGYDVHNEVVRDMFEAGIVDPALVISCSLENSMSVATSIMTTDVLIDNITQDKKE